jgi:predicted phage tail protein
MGSKASIDIQPEAARTDVISAYDQSFSVSEDGKPVPVVRGERKVAGRYIMCPFYGQRVVETPVKKQSSGGGK